MIIVDWYSMNVISTTCVLKNAVVCWVTADLIAKVTAEVAVRMATTRRGKNKACTKVDIALMASQKGTMKWLPFMSSFVLEKMLSLIKIGVRTDKGLKEVHLTTV